MGFLSTYAPYDEKFADQKTPLGREIVGEEQALIKALEERDFFLIIRMHPLPNKDMEGHITFFF